MSSRFLVLGGGIWGCALAMHLSRQSQAVCVWGREQPPISLDTIPFIMELGEAFEWAGGNATLLIAVPSNAFCEILARIRPWITDSHLFLWATKGLTEKGEFFHVVCQREYGFRPCAMLSGPSFAKEVIEGLPTAVTIAANMKEVGDRLAKAFHGPHFRVYLSSDMLGVQLGAVIKNILAIAVGIADGLQLGANARAGLMTRGIAELTRLGQKLGAQSATFMGLSGIGDIILTCTDNQSRNRRFGLLLGQGQLAEEAEALIGVVEGKMNVKQVVHLAHQCQVEMPICEVVYAILHESLTPAKAINHLLTRPASF